VFPWSKQSKMTYVDYCDVAESAVSAFTDERLSYGTFELAAEGMTRSITAADMPDSAAPMPDQPEGINAMLTA